MVGGISCVHDIAVARVVHMIFSPETACINIAVKGTSAKPKACNLQEAKAQEGYRDPELHIKLPYTSLVHVPYFR